MKVLNKRLSAQVAAIISLLVLLQGFNSCLRSTRSGRETDQPILLETETGNPMGPDALKIADTACSKIREAYPTLSAPDCQAGVLATSFGNTLGLPYNALNPFRQVALAEATAQVSANPVALAACLNQINSLYARSPQVLGAYNSLWFNPFAGVQGMIPTGGSCSQVYEGVTIVVNPPPPPPPKTVVVYFDELDVGGVLANHRLNGLYKGVDFQENFWNWSRPFDADSTVFLQAMTYGNDGALGFTQSPKTFVSIDVFTTKPGIVLTISDDLGQTVTQQIPNDHIMHKVTTGFSRPSNYLFFHVEGDSLRFLGFDNLTYRNPDVPPTITYVQTAVSGWGGGDYSRADAAFTSSITAGNLILAHVYWFDGSIGEVTDSLGNTYLPATEEVSVAFGDHQQLWYTISDSGGAESVTVSMVGSIAGPSLVIHEYSGIDSSNPLVAGITATNGAQLTSVAHIGPVYSSASSALLYGAAQTYHLSNYSFQDGFIQRVRSGEELKCGDKVVSAPGNYDLHVAFDGGTHRWAGFLVVFKGK